MGKIAALLNERLISSVGLVGYVAGDAALLGSFGEALAPLRPIGALLVVIGGIMAIYNKMTRPKL